MQELSPAIKTAKIVEPSLSAQAAGLSEVFESGDESVALYGTVEAAMTVALRL